MTDTTYKRSHRKDFENMFPEFGVTKKTFVDKMTLAGFRAFNHGKKKTQWYYMCFGHTLRHFRFFTQGLLRCWAYLQWQHM